MQANQSVERSPPLFGNAIQLRFAQSSYPYIAEILKQNK